ncbi:MAG: SulP family inorganic anion transporter, partial [Bacteroidota bacterium]
FFQSFPIAGGFSRTAVNNQAGAKTGLAAIISASLVIITLLLLTDYFYHLPTAVLSAIILVAVVGLIDLKEAQHLWQTDRRDFVLFVLTALGTLSLGVEQGILLGTLLSLGLVIYNISYPHVAVLGRSKEGQLYRNIERFEDVEQIEGTLIVRLDAQLYFANIQYFTDFIGKQIRQSPTIRQLILDARAINQLDASAIDGLRDLIVDLRQQDIHFYMVNIKGPIRDKLQSSQMMELIGQDHIFNNIQEAVHWITTKVQPATAHRKYALQSNTKPQ